MQVATEASKYSQYLSKVKTVCIYGGAPYPFQNRELAKPYEILVATPGRLIDHMERGRINFSRLEVLILDEADRMLDMGFIEPVEKIAKATPDSRQTLLFSATMKGSVLNLSRNLLNNPVEINIISDILKHENIEQRLHYVDGLDHKYRLLQHLLEDPTINQAIVFTSTKRHADQLVEELYERGYQAAALHGDMNQRQRTRTVSRLRSGEIRILVATDIAARGIDVQTISHVINFDLPGSVEDYVHRIGRTGRAGACGIALSLANTKETQLVRRIEAYTGKKITPHVIPGMEPVSKGGGRPRRNFRSRG
jgi:superfamily II DNA/RNA helicase